VVPRAPDRVGLRSELDLNLAPVHRLGLERQLEHDAIALKHVVVHVVTHVEGALLLHQAELPEQHRVARLHGVERSTTTVGRAVVRGNADIEREARPA
jgi:hypothetical protein